MRAHRLDRGASAIEYAGLIVLAALILGSLTTLGVPEKVRGGLSTALCKIVGGTNCGGSTAGGTNTDSGRPPGGNRPPSSNQPPVAGGEEPGLLPSLTRTFGNYFRGFKNFVGFGPAKPSRSKLLQPNPFNYEPGVFREWWEQLKGVGGFVKMTWCTTGLCTDAAVKEARDGWAYIFDHPRDAFKQAGYSIVEPCLKAWRAPNWNQRFYWAGRCNISLASTVIGAKGLGKAGKLSRLSKLAKAAELAGKLKGLTRLSSDAGRAAREAERAARSGNLTAARKYAAQARRAADKARNALRQAGCRPVAVGPEPPTHLGGRASVTMKPDPACPTGRRQTFQARKDARRAAQAVAQAQAKLLTRQIKKAQLPTTGRIRFIAARDVQALTQLRNGGYADRFGNVWVRGPSRTPGEPFEWDVQLSKSQQRNWQWLLKAKGRKGTVTHLNVSLKGHITHVS